MSGDDAATTIAELLETATDLAERDDFDTVITSLVDQLRVQREEQTVVETEGNNEEVEFTELAVDEDGFEQVLEFLYSHQDTAPTSVRRQTMRIAGGLIDALMMQSSAAVSYRGDPAVNELVPVLATGLSDTDETVRKTAAEQLSLVARTQEQPLGHRVTSQTPVHLVVDDLRRGLDREDSVAIRGTIAEALNRLSTERPSAVEPAIPELCAASKNSEADIRHPTVAALAHICRTERLDYRSARPPYSLTSSSAHIDLAIDTLSELLAHSDVDTRERAATGISNAAYHLPAAVDPVVPEICRALQTTDGDTAETLTSAIAYLSRAHPLLAVPAVPVLETQNASAYARGARQHIVGAYPSVVDTSEQFGNESGDLPSDVTDELLLNREQSGRDIRDVLEATRHDTAARSQSDVIDALCTPLLAFEDARTAVFACETLARSAAAGGEITERACEGLLDLAGGPHRIETAPRVSLQIIQQHQPSVVESVSTASEVSLTVFDSNR